MYNFTNTNIKNKDIRINYILYYKMQFEKPISTGYMIYTKSNCPYCVKVKELLLRNEGQEVTIVNCDKYLVEPEVKEKFLEFIQSINGGNQHRTFPIVFYQGKFIGGFTETEKFYTKKNIFTIDADF